MLLLPIIFALSGCGQPAPRNCALAKVGDFFVTFIGRAPVIVVKLDGRDEHMLVDTGSGVTFVTPKTYTALDLNYVAPIDGNYGEGLGGAMQMNAAIQEDLGIGGVTLKDEDMVIADFGVPRKNGRPLADGLLGFDALQSFDIAFDLPHSDISFYLPVHCATSDTPWTGDYAVAPYVPRPDRLNDPAISVQVDDRNFTADIDSGAAWTLFWQKALLGGAVRPEASAKTRAGYGIGRKVFGYSPEQFASLTIGAETFTDAWVAVSARSIPGQTVAGLIGQDYLAHHRVFLANDTRTAYLGTTLP